MAELLTALDSDRLRSHMVEARERVAAACATAGRNPDQVELLAASKYVPNELMGQLAQAGVTLVGENTAQSLAAKHERWGDRLTFDFIGHLQSRKTKDVLPLVRLIHSVESESVVARIEQHAQREVRVLLEVNLSGEPSKHGVAASEVDSFLQNATSSKHCSFAGLMTMPPATTDPERARPIFASLRELAERLRREWQPRHSFDVLSMGTSQDYAVAVEEGATIVRLGNTLYR